MSSSPLRRGSVNANGIRRGLGNANGVCGSTNANAQSKAESGSSCREEANSSNEAGPSTELFGAGAAAASSDGNGGLGRDDAYDSAGDAEDRYSMPLFTLANLRGDVSSVPASLHAALGIRLYRLVDFVLEEKLSIASWPAWNALVLKLRASSEAMKQRALFRLPRIYRAAVWFLVASAVLADSFILGSQTGRLLSGAWTETSWLPHSIFGAALGLLMNIFLSWCVFLLLAALSNMENPFASDWLDLCGLSYVCAAAEISLRMVTGAGDHDVSAQGPAGPVMHSFQDLDRNSLLEAMGKKEKDEEEEEEAEEDGGDE